MAESTTQPAASPGPSEAVLVLDRALRVMGRNRAAGELLGLELDQGATFDPAAHFEQPSPEEVSNALGRVLAGGPALAGQKGRLALAGGRSFSCEYAIDPLHGAAGQLAGVILTIRDLDYSPLLDDLAEAQAVPPHVPRLGYQALVDNLAEGIFTINTQWRITSFNQTAERITGYRREEVLGRFCWEIFRSELCQAECPLKTTLETGLARMDQDVRMFSKEGRHISVLCNTSVVKDSSGRVAGAVESFRPINLPEPEPAGAKGGRAFPEIIGASPALRRLFDMLPDVAASEASVIITGESGTGKELFARAIHHNSPRRHGPFTAVNCSALAESLLESELFGHEKAAFTGAVRSKVGRFELAKGGTLFFDEIGDLKPELQIKLLRVLEDRAFERVGGTRRITLDARVLAATNRDLARALAEGAFREDLYYRLRTVHFDLPPLRRRKEDIPLLVNHFIARLNRATGKEVRSLDPKVMTMFMDYGWPGNVRELERVLEHAFVFVKGPVIFASNLPDLDGMAPAGEPEPEPAGDERGQVLAALQASGGRREQAARMLGISRTSLWRRMKRLGLT